MLKKILIALALSASVAHADLAPAKDRVVVMISLDGLAGFYFDEGQAPMPTLRALMKDGASSSMMRAVAPTVTWPNHTTLVTGDFPTKHGVTGNNYLDRATTKPVTLISDPVFDKDEIVKVPTIYDLAKEAGLSTAALRWPASRGAKTLDWTVPDCSSPKLLEKYSTPELFQEMKAAGVFAEPATQPATTQSTVDSTTLPATPPTTGPAAAAADEMGPSLDDVSTNAFIRLLREHKPNLALLHLASVDHNEHLFGPRSPKALEAIADNDANVKKIWDVLKNEFAGKATLIIVSDHGFSPINRALLPNVVLRDAGLLKVKGQRVVDGPLRVVAQGGCAMVYVLDDAHRAEVTKKAKAAFDHVDGVDKVVGVEDFAKYGIADPKNDPHSPDFVVFAQEGYTMGDTAAGSLTFQEKPERKGTHGHNPDLPHLHATFIAWGVGITHGVALGEFQNTDVAPTIARLIGVEMKDVDGKPLDAALAK